VTFNQVYENKSEAAIETLFMMPTSESFSVNHMTVDFFLSDGTKETLVTRVAEREKAKVEYDDAVATGKTAVMSHVTYKTLERSGPQIFKMFLGNFPPQSKAHIQV